MNFEAFMLVAIEAIQRFPIHQGDSVASFRSGILKSAEFSSNPNQTLLSMLINVFRIIRKSQVGEFDQGSS